MTHRCSICNKTDQEDLVSELGEYTDEPFLDDPSNPLFEVCLTCYEIINESLGEFEDDGDGEAFDYS